MCPITRETVEAWLRKNTNRMGTFIADQWVLYIRAAIVDVETLRSFNALCLFLLILVDLLLPFLTLLEDNFCRAT